MNEMDEKKIEQNRGKYTEQELRDQGEVSLLVLSDLC